MSATISNPAKCEVLAVKHILLAKNCTVAEINWQIVEVYGPDVMIGTKVQQWYRLFKEGLTNVMMKSVAVAQQ